MDRVLISVLLIVSGVYGYDSSQKACWDIRLQDSSLFCYDKGNNGVVWALSEDVFYNAKANDTCKFNNFLSYLGAANMYQNMLDKWQAGTPDAPTNDCLAIGRMFYCAVAFPAC